MPRISTRHGLLDAAYEIVRDHPGELTAVLAGLVAQRANVSRIYAKHVLMAMRDAGVLRSVKSPPSKHDERGGRWPHRWWVES